MNNQAKTKRNLIEGRAALIVVDIQAETFGDRTDEAIYCLRIALGPRFHGGDFKLRDGIRLRG